MVWSRILSYLFMHHCHPKSNLSIILQSVMSETVHRLYMQRRNGRNSRNTERYPGDTHLVKKQPRPQTLFLPSSSFPQIIQLVARTWSQYHYSTKWRFPKIGIPPSQWDFPRKKPSILGTPISENHLKSPRSFCRSSWPSFWVPYSAFHFASMCSSFGDFHKWGSPKMDGL